MRAGPLTRLTLLMAAVQFLASCFHSHQAADIDWAAMASAGAFRLGGGDRLHVEVQDHPELSRDVVVRPDGMITMPLIGEISARDRLPEELAKDITRQLSRFVKSPVVTVSVQQVNSYAVYVLGEVRRPGEYRASEPMTVLQALARAGGFTEFARKGRILVLRRRSGQPDLSIPIDYDAIVSGDAPQQNIVLAGGDTVIVP